ncbi:MAG: molybdopterin-dependent oxidoreductase [Xanthobacteraceae bacterium]|nr:molybdopterin-dependent oxidoreductase [Xanthobacteraceae bacterium]QYK45179.1 MAG: molybdopterin-dependent oxidoreductase [Xanthobacteraceae bacterium]
MNMQAPMLPSVRTACPYCGVGCGVLARADGKGGADISGDPEHPANFGRLCSKGTALGETLRLDGRLLHPMLRRNGALERTGWGTALDTVAHGFSEIVARHGPDAVAFYLSGQLLTEDYYVANKLMKGFIGSANVDTNSRLCMSSSVAAHRRAFGADTVPGIYEDLDEADLIILTGSNAAWCHPVLFRRMTENRERRGAKLVVIDPRRTATAQEADLFLPVAPGMDTVLFSGLLAELADRHTLDFSFISSHTSGFEAALARAREIAPSLERVAALTRLPKKDVLRFYELFRTTKRTVTCYSQGVNQSAQGTDKANAIINCHLATGRIGRAGMGPFSLTGQPNAMGGREVGGLANQLAAHMNFTPAEIDRVGRFWRAPRMAQREGLKAVQMFEAIERGEIKGLWVMATNPVVSLPRSGAMAEALKKLELFVVSDNMLSNDTIASGAHVLLPAAAWGEKDGTVTNSERRISRQRAFLPLPGEAKPDWKIVSEVAARMGFGEAFAYSCAADIFREHAALSAFENGGSRDFDIGGLAALSGEAYDSLEPVLWPVRAGTKKSAPRFFDNGHFYTADQRAKFVAPEQPALREDVSSSYPFVLNTGRIRDQWHTMTRSGQSVRLAQHRAEPFVEIHPDDARWIGLAEGSIALVRSRQGEAAYRVRFDEGLPRGSLFAPIHWSLENTSAARTGNAVAPATDPLSGQPEAKATPAAIEPLAFSQAGFVVSRSMVRMPAQAWWSRATVEDGSHYIFAANESVGFWRTFAAKQIAKDCEVIEFCDEAAGVYRVAGLRGNRLEFCLFSGPFADTPAADSVKAALARVALNPDMRRTLLSGKSAEGLASDGPTVCACYGVGLNRICAAIESGKATTVEEIGAALRAGTNCGSCKPELKRILSYAKSAPVAEAV